MSKALSHASAHQLPQLPTVFIVDDDRMVRRSLARLVRSAGYPVETFPSPRDLLSRPGADPTGCILLDLLMPGLDGLQAQQAFSKDGLNLPVIFLTGHGDVSSSVQAMKAGAIDFLIKPPDARDLFLAIDRAIEHDRSSRNEREEIATFRARYESLTPREREVCIWVATGLLNKQIADRLGTSEKTVKVHRGQGMHKFGIRSVAELVRIVDRLGLRVPED
jgi:FixJ family two-component response regulator